METLTKKKSRRWHILWNIVHGAASYSHGAAKHMTLLLGGNMQTRLNAGMKLKHIQLVFKT